MKRLFIGLQILLAGLSFSVYSQVTYLPIESEHNIMILQLEKNVTPKINYFGAKFSSNGDYSQIARQYRQGSDYSGILNAAYTSSGSRNLVEPAIEVIHADGNTSLDLHYLSHKTISESDNVTLTKIELADPVYAFQVTLNYKVYKNEDVVEQWAEIRHQEKGDVILNKFASANLYLKSAAFYLRQYHGDWAKEMQPEESRITHGIKVLDSKLGARADLYQPPTFMVSLGQPAGEDSGEVLYGSVEWSGNFRVDLELDPLNNLRLIAGANNHASAYHLKKNETFTTPVFLYTFSNKGKGAASRNLQSWARNYKILDGNGSRLTLLNNWEATFFDFNEQKLARLLKDTKELGVDLFLLDDGWFANKYPRNADNAGLGDWQENKKKLPNGIAALVEEADANGVKFGIWLEPEMVNPKSELYEKHPDWVIKQPQRTEYLYRNQLVLDLSNPQVQDFVFRTVDDLFQKNPGLAYIKWDCNAVIYNAYSAHLKQQTHLYLDYVKGLYKVLERVRAKYPKIPMMLCSGGGGRVDYAALKYFTEFWPSDNTDPLERVFLQWEYSYFYPSIALASHVTDWGKQPLKFKTDVAMMGKLGFDIDISKLSEKDLTFAKQAVGVYNQIKQQVWHANEYRLLSPWENDYAALMYSEKGGDAVLFCYMVNNRYDAGSKTPVKLKGLEPTAKYKITELNLYPGTKSPFKENEIYTGDFLMQIGFNPQVSGGRTSAIFNVELLK
ncbi:alpha-galactosidase [Pedobacter aquatilis]|uniref:alpha-galactosidase n=1 Tax=Pedobacter aquatilis TaxID=351343 RepID=UPI00292CD912|nr:alpha-galactosidase [Pedobacter aquatilis]